MNVEQRPPWYFLLLLILAGESVFILPFVLARVFRPTVLEAFSLDNVQLGLCFSVYGIVAVGSYLLGGPLADKFPPRKLIASALWATAAGGLVYATFPSLRVLQVLYAWWGFTTIFLAWAPMIKATRVWGGTQSQGKAFGFLDGGRGLVGALFGSLGVIVFTLFLTTEIAEATQDQSQEAFKYVIWVATALVALVGVLVWFFLHLDQELENSITIERITTSQIKQVLNLPSVRLLMMIILCGYVGYKVTDIFSLYAQDVMHYDQIASAQVGTYLLYIRPVIGVSIGILADRSQTTFWLMISFIVLFFGSLLLASGVVIATAPTLFFVSILIVAAGVYAARCLYFSVMQSGQIPLVLTGTAVGMISIVGYTPDIFVGPVVGYFLDSYPGIVGHQKVFLMLSIFAFVGTLSSWRYYKLYHTTKQL